MKNIKVVKNKGNSIKCTFNSLKKGKYEKNTVIYIWSITE